MFNLISKNREYLCYKSWLIQPLRQNLKSFCEKFSTFLMCILHFAYDYFAVERRSLLNFVYWGHFVLFDLRFSRETVLFEHVYKSFLFVFNIATFYVAIFVCVIPRFLATLPRVLLYVLFRRPLFFCIASSSLFALFISVLLLRRRLICLLYGCNLMSSHTLDKS